MPLLAFDTSGRDAVVGLILDDGQTVTREVPREAGRHARMLIPTAAALVEEAGLATTDLTGLAVNLGPGSFTGLRVGVAAVQTLAWACDIPCIGVPLFDLLAAGSDPARDRLLVANAEREQCFVATVAAGATTPGEFTIEDDEAVVARAAAGCQVVAPAPPRLGLADEHLIELQRPAIEVLMTLASERLAAGQAVPPPQLLPIYGRRSAAEELRDAGRRPKYEQQQ